jgi:enediyne biosynthesis protein E4
MKRTMLLSLLLLSLATSADAQVSTIVDEIGTLESVRDPKCYATASRLEDFIYGTPLDSSARFEKISLQKRFILDQWLKVSAKVPPGGKELPADVLRPVLLAAVPWSQAPNGDWVVWPDDPRRTVVTARDKRQYGSVAYALRAILAVQQDALLDTSVRLAPLSSEAVDVFKEAVDLLTLAALQKADQASRRANADRLGPEPFRAAWTGIVGLSAPLPARPAVPRSEPARGERFATINAVVAEKLAAFAAYNNLSMAVFLRNLQVYMARHLWPSDPEEGKRFKDQFTEVMVAWTTDVLLEAEKVAKKAGHPLIRVEDVDTAVQTYEPHEMNAYEDIVFFPRLPRNERIVIEAYDLDSFRDPGLHWVYLKEVLHDPAYRGTLEPDPFAAELLVEGVAQFGVLVLRVAGNVAAQEGKARLEAAHLGKALKRIQLLLDRNASAPEPKPVPGRVASAPGGAARADGKFFTDVTAASGILFEHRMSDWLSRFIRGYTVVEGDLVRLAVPPTFGGAGVAAEDIDGDGDVDILILGGAGNALYLNDGKGRFTDATEASGLSWKRPDGTRGEPRQPIVADFDNDGRQDVFVSYVDDDHRLYRNLGGARFEDVTARANLGGKGLVGGPATALDFDGDGLLDLYVGYFGDYLKGVLPTLARRNGNGLPNKLFRNKGDFVFEDVTAGSGVDDTGWAQAIGHVDFDGDGREDLICGNDFGTNAWYRNLGKGKFEDVSARLGTDKPSYTMGIGITDLNRDGFPDVYISNIVVMDKDEKYVLPDTNTRMKFNPQKMANMRVVEANDLFTSVAKDGRLASYEPSDAVGPGLSSTGWAWGASFFDFDNDGDDDLYVVNGMNEYAVYSSVNPYFTDSAGRATSAVLPVADKEVPVFFVNSGGTLRQETAASGADPAGNARSVAYLDFDDDGDLDMVVNGFGAPARIYRNNAESRGNRWIKVSLVGDPARGVTRDAIGARVLVDTPSQKGLWRTVFSTVGYLTGHPKQQHVGLGAATTADVTVIWPGGTTERFEGLAAGRSYRIEQGKGIQ